MIHLTSLRRCRSPQLMTVFFCLALQCFSPVVLLADTDAEISFDVASRQWSDTTGKYTVKATLIKYHNREVTLRNDEGKEITVPLDRLSTYDRVYLARQRRLHRNQTERPEEEQKQETLATSIREDRPEKLFGVDWFPLDTAQQIASRENKPVMWFRVLGDLTGFM